MNFEVAWDKIPIKVGDISVDVHLPVLSSLPSKDVGPGTGIVVRKLTEYEKVPKNARRAPDTARNSFVVL